MVRVRRRGGDPLPLPPSGYIARRWWMPGGFYYLGWNGRGGMPWFFVCPPICAPYSDGLAMHKSDRYLAQRCRRFVHRPTDHQSVYVLAERDLHGYPLIARTAQMPPHARYVLRLLGGQPRYVDALPDRATLHAAGVQRIEDFNPDDGAQYVPVEAQAMEPRRAGSRASETEHHETVLLAALDALGSLNAERHHDESGRELQKVEAAQREALEALLRLENVRETLEELALLRGKGGCHGR